MLLRKVFDTKLGGLRALVRKGWSPRLDIKLAGTAGRSATSRFAIGMQLSSQTARDTSRDITDTLSKEETERRWRPLARGQRGSTRPAYSESCIRYGASSLRTRNVIASSLNGTSALDITSPMRCCAGGEFLGSGISVWARFLAAALTTGACMGCWKPRRGAPSVNPGKTRRLDDA